VIAIALLSGISEELFFRGVLLPEIGIVASSAIFGALHALTPLYALWAGLTGAGFALLTMYGGSLVTAIIAHATYNAGALFALRHWQTRQAMRERAASTGDLTPPVRERTAGATDVASRAAFR
jgi:membrane protease YdiL (CAAX protease family)